MIVQFKTSAMKNYKAIYIKTEESDLSADNIYDAIHKGEEEAKKKGMVLGQVVDQVKGEKIVYKPKIEMV